MLATEVKLAAGMNAPAVARETAAEFFAAQLKGDSVERLRLLVSEVVTHAVERTEGRRRVLALAMSQDDGRLRVEVANAGAPPGHDPAGQVGELRLALLQQLAAEWGIDAQSGGRVWFVLEV